MREPRVRFNAKARQSSAGGRKKNRKAQAEVVGEVAQDSNAEVILPRTKEQKERDKKDRLQFELMTQSESKMNSKKKKRLDKYIEKKLQQEERVVILEKLKRSQTELPTTINLQSSSTLGTGRALTHRERFERLEDNSVSASESGDNSSDAEEAKLGSGSEHVQVQPKRPRFKEWALQQLSAAKGYVAPPPPTEDQISVDPEPSQLQLSPAKKRKISDPKAAEIRGPLGETVVLPCTVLSEQLRTSSAVAMTEAVMVTRPPEVEETRLLLPIIAEEQPIMEAIRLSPVVIICGETGSGKTTQLPQFLYEAGFGTPGSENPGMIGITQPRRVAAVSMAARVAYELSLTSSRVSYQIRYDATVSSATSIKFMTDGVLLRELATDFLLTKYSVIIIDEAHERSMNTDILIGVVSRVLKLREEMWKEGKDGVKVGGYCPLPLRLGSSRLQQPLRLVIMSATLRVADFAENKTLFPSPPPIINVPARQHPVTIHFNRRTPSDYVAEAVKKASKIHSRLPPGGILIFLTGQNEITGVCRKLEAKYGKKALEEKRCRRGTDQQQFDSSFNTENQSVALGQADVEAEDIDLGTADHGSLASDVDGDLPEDNPDALDSDDEGDLNRELGIDLEESDAPMHVAPLYSLLSSEKQMQVFQPPPPGSRLVVVATNVAETSLTIPGIRYVVDCGRAKERRYDVANGIQTFQVAWISKASAAQRAGRAGRTGPGHCYRLYSSALYEHHFDPFSQPEILRMPIEGVVLQMKSMHIDAVANFPFPTPPDRLTLRKAETVLTHLGALAVSAISKGGQVIDNATIGGQITDLGRAMSLFPLSPRFSRMLVSGRQQGCLPYVIAIVSALSVGDPFLREEALSGDAEEATAEDDSPTQDTAHTNSETVRANEEPRTRRKAYFQAQQTHGSLGNFKSDVFRMLSVVGAYEYAGGSHQFCAENFVRPKAMEEIHKLRAQISNIVAAHFPSADVGYAAKLKPPNDLQLKLLRQLLAAAFIDQVAIRKDLISRDPGGTKFANCRGIPYQAFGIHEDVFIHPSSVLMSAPPPEYVVFHDVVRTSRVWIKGLTVTNPAWLAHLGKGTLCSFSKPVKNKEGIPMVTPHFGPGGWELPPMKAQYGYS